MLAATSTDNSLGRERLEEFVGHGIHEFQVVRIILTNSVEGGRCDRPNPTIPKKVQKFTRETNMMEEGR